MNKEAEQLSSQAGGWIGIVKYAETTHLGHEIKAGTEVMVLYKEGDFWICRLTDKVRSQHLKQVDTFPVSFDNLKRVD